MNLPTAPNEDSAETGSPLVESKGTKRLHVSTMGIPFVESLFGLIIPFVVMSFAMTPRRASLICGLFIALPTAIRFILQYASTHYRLDEVELFIRSGIIFRKERRIPLERIQDIEIHQSLFRRLLGLANLKVTTAGAETEEASLNVLSLPEAERMREQVSRFQIKSSPVPETESEPEENASEELAALGWRDLALGGLTSNLVAALAAMLGAFLYLDYFESWGMSEFDSRFEDMIQEQTEKMNHSVPLTTMITPIIHFFFLSGSVGKALLFAIFGSLGSIASFIVRYYGFRLIRNNNIISRSYGLLNTRRTSLSQNRIQAIRLEEGLLRRLFGLVAIRADSAGDRQQIDENKKREWLLPVAKKDHAMATIQDIQPELEFDPAEWQALSPKAILRRTFVVSMFFLLAAGQTFIIADWVALAWLPTPLIAYYANVQWFRNTGYNLTDRHILWKTGWIQRTALFLPIKNIQNVSLNQSPFDRRLKLASLAIDTAGQSNTGGGPTIRHLPIEEARVLQESIIQRVAHTKFIW